MNTRKMVGTLLLVIGIVVLIVFAIADVVGIGENPEFGPWQITGTIVGAVVAIIGIGLLCKKRQDVATG